MVECLFTFAILIIFFAFFYETFLLIQNSIHTQRIARESAREAGLVGSIDMGQDKGEDLARLYFGSNSAVDLDINRSSTTSVTCKVTYHMKPLKVLSDNGYGLEVALHGKAVFPWWDHT